MRSVSRLSQVLNKVYQYSTRLSRIHRCINNTPFLDWYLYLLAPGLLAILFISDHPTRTIIGSRGSLFLSSHSSLASCSARFLHFCIDCIDSWRFRSASCLSHSSFKYLPYSFAAWSIAWSLVLVHCIYPRSADKPHSLTGRQQESRWPGCRGNYTGAPGLLESFDTRQWKDKRPTVTDLTAGRLITFA